MLCYCDEIPDPTPCPNPVQTPGKEILKFCPNEPFERIDFFILYRREISCLGIPEPGPWILVHKKPAWREDYHHDEDLWVKSWLCYFLPARDDPEFFSGHDYEYKVRSENLWGDSPDSNAINFQGWEICKPDQEICYQNNLTCYLLLREYFNRKGGGPCLKDNTAEKQKLIRSQ